MNGRPEAADHETPPPMPTRSRLYGLELLGRGTWLVEGVASYVDRLAQAHGVPPWMLVVRGDRATGFADAPWRPPAGIVICLGTWGRPFTGTAPLPVRWSR
jgi:hypothetical protein